MSTTQLDTHLQNITRQALYIQRNTVVHSHVYTASANQTTSNH